MTEIYKRVIPYRVTMICDICRKGYMSPTGTGFSNGFKTTYNHICSNVDCGHSDKYDIQYPYIKYIEDD